MTVTGTEATFPSDVALMEALPIATPLTSPLALTVAIAVLDDDQAIVRPVSAVPKESESVAVRDALPATPTVSAVGAMVMVATGRVVTITDAEPVLASTVAVMVAVPAETPRTRPAASTVAAARFELDQMVDLPATIVPALFFGDAASWSDCPTPSVTEVGVTSTVATALGDGPEESPLHAMATAASVSERTRTAR